MKSCKTCRHYHLDATGGGALLAAFCGRPHVRDGRAVESSMLGAAQGDAGVPPDWCPGWVARETDERVVLKVTDEERGLVCEATISLRAVPLSRLARWGASILRELARRVGSGEDAGAITRAESAGREFAELQRKLEGVEREKLFDDEPGNREPSEEALSKSSPASRTPAPGARPYGLPSSEPGDR